MREITLVPDASGGPTSRATVARVIAADAAHICIGRNAADGIQDPAISRTHVHVARAEGGAVSVTFLSQRRGAVCLPGGAGWQAVAPGATAPVAIGGRFALAYVGGVAKYAFIVNERQGPPIGSQAGGKRCGVAAGTAGATITAAAPKKRKDTATSTAAATASTKRRAGGAAPGRETQRPWTGAHVPAEHRGAEGPPAPRGAGAEGHGPTPTPTPATPATPATTFWIQDAGDVVRQPTLLCRDSGKGAGKIKQGVSIKFKAGTLTRQDGTVAFVLLVPGNPGLGDACGASLSANGTSLSANDTVYVLFRWGTLIRFKRWRSTEPLLELGKRLTKAPPMPPAARRCELSEGAAMKEWVVRQGEANHGGTPSGPGWRNFGELKSKTTKGPGAWPAHAVLVDTRKMAAAAGSDDDGPRALLKVLVEIDWSGAANLGGAENAGLSHDPPCFGPQEASQT